MGLVAQRVAKNTIFLTGRMVLTVFISLYSTRLVLGALGVQDFGLFNLIGGAIASLTFLNSALASSTQRFMSFAIGEGIELRQKRIFNVSSVLHIMVALAIAIFLELVGSVLFGRVFKIDHAKIDTAKLLYQIMILSTFLSVISVPYDAVLNARENMFFVSILGIVESLMKLTLALLVNTALSNKLELYGALTLVITLILYIVKLLYCHRKYREIVWAPVLYFHKETFGQLGSFAGWTLIGSATSMFSNYGQVILMNSFFGTIVNAAHGIVTQLNGQLNAFANTIAKAIVPVITKSEGAGNRRLMLKATYTGIKAPFFLLLLFYVPVMVEMPFVLQIWLKDVPKYTLIFSELLLIRNLVEYLVQPLAYSIAAIGNIRRFQFLASILNMIPLLVGYLLFKLGLPPYALYCVFLGYSAAYGMLLVLTSRKNFQLDMSDFFRKVILPCIGCTTIVFLSAAITHYLMETGYWRLAIVAVVNIIFLAITVWVIGLDLKEKQILMSLARTLLIRVAPAKVFLKGQ